MSQLPNMLLALSSSLFADYNSIECAEIVWTSRRASKKYWVADSQELLANVVLILIDGKHNVLLDVRSRLPWELVVAKHLPVPNGPLLDFIRLLFTSPTEVADAVIRQGTGKREVIGGIRKAE